MSESSDLPPPLSRADQQNRTRAALVASARRVFARDGFHGANLAAIASEARLTKGAVYSNFDGKADLFLAVLDADLAGIEPESWDPVARFATTSTSGSGVRARDLSPEEQDGLGFGLATLEFVASAARDPQLLDELDDRLRRFLAGFEAVARRRRRDEDALSIEQLGAMLMAFDQGSAILWLIGWLDVDDDMVRRGMLRVLRPVADEDGAAL
jgi:AcrR family transcriptional regulator